MQYRHVSWAGFASQTSAVGEMGQPSMKAAQPRLLVGHQRSNVVVHKYSRDELRPNAMTIKGAKSEQAAL